MDKKTVAFATIAVMAGVALGFVRMSRAYNPATIGRSDSSFAALQNRGQSVMGVGQYTSKHRFEPLPDGGRVVLQREEQDSAGEATIRAHMTSIAAAFTAGDFTSPEMVHNMADVPGTAVMTKLKSEISYVASDIPRGGEVRITSRNPEAVKAIHEFLAFQRMDHHAGM